VRKVRELTIGQAESALKFITENDVGRVTLRNIPSWGVGVILFEE
jgi:hypothetical protein